MASDRIVIQIDAKSDADAVIRKVESALKGLKKSSDDAKKSTDGAGKSMQGVERVAQGVGGKVGELTGRFKSLGEGIALLGGAGGAAVIATAAVAGLAVALGAMAVASVKVVAAADDAYDRLIELGRASEADAESVRTANDALSGLRTISDELTTTLADDLAPAVERLATVAVALGLAAKDAYESLGGLEGIAEDLSSPITALEDGMSALAVKVGLLSEEDAALAKALREIRDDTSAFDTQVGALEEHLGDYVTQAQEVVGQITAHREATERAKVSTKEWTDENRRLVGWLREETKALQERQLAAAEALAARQEDATAQRDLFKERQEQFVADQETADRNSQIARDATERAAAESAALQASVRESITGSVTDTLGAVASLADTFGATLKAGSKEAKAFWIAQKVASLSQVAINTAEAITKGIATWGPPPSPPGIAAIAAAIAIGGAQAALIASQKPPTYHLGTLGFTAEEVGTRAGTGSGAGDIAATIQAGEEVVTKEQAERARGSASQPVVLVQMDSRYYEAQARASLERGVLRRAVRPGESTGQERYVTNG